MLPCLEIGSSDLHGKFIDIVQRTSCVLTLLNIYKKLSLPVPTWNTVGSCFSLFNLTALKNPQMFPTHVLDVLEIYVVI